MGYPNRFKIVFVVCCLLLTGGLLYSRPGPTLIQKAYSLSETLISFDNWSALNDVPLQSDIQDALQLDDYLYRQFTDGFNVITVYIGYYYTKSKVGAAHDPLVCFPGQGWELSNRDYRSIDLSSGLGKLSVDYATMQAGRNDRNTVLLYWFQAQDKTASDTLSQKIILLWKSIPTGLEENAFVRLSMDRQGKSYEECLSTLTQFVESFYPEFYKFVQSAQQPREMK